MFFDDSKTNNIIVSIIWGIGISTIFRKICTNNNCIVIQSSKIDDNDKYIYFKNDKCYTLNKQKIDCTQK